jgi:hypothetical protein
VGDAARRAEYYKNVDEVVTDQQAWQGKQLQLHGYVVPGSVLRGTRRVRHAHARVPLQSPESPPRANETTDVHMVEASYTGIVPDTFKGEAEVVLKGTTGSNWIPDGPERRHGQVPVEVPGREFRLIDGIPRLVPPAGQLRHLRLRRHGVGCRRATPVAASD